MDEDIGQTFALEDEDHTLGNSLRFFLNKKYDTTIRGVTGNAGLSVTKPLHDVSHASVLRPSLFAALM